jgi:hypothetical protein
MTSGSSMAATWLLTVTSARPSCLSSARCRCSSPSTVVLLAWVMKARLALAMR